MKLPDFRNEKNQPLAIWIQAIATSFQTLLFIAGFIFAVAQFSVVIENQETDKNKMLLQFQKDFSATINKQIRQINQFYVDKEVLDDVQYLNKYSLENFQSIEENIQRYIVDLSSCGELGLCPAEHVNNQICTLSKQLFLSYRRFFDAEWTMQLWNIKYSDLSFYEQKIDKHCEFFDSVWFWWFET